jgi:RimJ/RimL family protein N-acetyltransferase
METLLYSHETRLHDPVPQFRIVSKKLPQLQLRCAEPTDSAALLKLFTDQRNVQYDSSCNGLDNAAAIDALIKQWSTFSKPLERANAVIVIDNKIAGTGGLGWIGKSSEGKTVGDAGVMLDSEFRGKGYAYEALRIIIDHGFRVLGMDEVHIATRDANNPMKGLMNKLGFSASPISDEKFGNDWIWRIKREQWNDITHSKA